MWPKFWSGWLVLVLLLAACTSSQTVIPDTPAVAIVEPTATLQSLPQQEALPTETRSPTSTPVPATATTMLEELPPVPSGCTVVTRKYSPEPTQESIFPPVSSTDWIIGPETAAVTLIEYGDFQ